MRLIVPPIAILLLILVSAANADARTLIVPLGREATWVKLDTGEQRVQGRRIGRVELDVRRVRATCLRSDAEFDDMVQLVAEPSPIGRHVKFRCLKRAETRSGAGAG